MPAENPPPLRVGILLIEGFALMSYAALTEPLRAANLLAGRPLFDVAGVAVSGDAVRSSGGALVPCLPIAEAPRSFDLLLVAAGGDPAAFRDERAFAWLRRMGRAGVTLGGVSGGPMILARAGLMAGRRMTVHWEHAGALAEIAPDLMLERALYVIDRDRMTCAGGAAPMDMMHAVIAERHGPALARRVSDWFHHTEIRPAGGPQRAGGAARHGVTDRAVLAAIEAMENHIADPLDLTRLSAIAGVGPRQLSRLFRDRLGTSAMAFYRRLRLATARDLARATPLSMTEIALAAGFAGSSHFSSAHARAYGAPPSSLRRGGRGEEREGRRRQDR